MQARHSRRADPPCAALPALQVVMQYSGKSVHTSWKMKGDLIYFPHDGPKEIHTKLTDTESWKEWLTEWPRIHRASLSCLPSGPTSITRKSQSRVCSTRSVHKEL